MEICVKNEFTNTDKMQYACNFEGCKSVFYKPSTLKWHMNTHLNMRPFVCNHEGCDKSYPNPSNLKRHILSHSNNPNSIEELECKHCKKHFRYINNLQRHIKNTHSKDSKYCKKCNKKFRDQSVFEDHMKIFHDLNGSKSKIFKCELCGKQLKTFETYRKHKQKRLCRKLFCSFKNCTEVFYSLPSLKQHRKSLNHRIIKYTCADCDAGFSCKTNLENHVLIHFEKRDKFFCTYKNCKRYYLFKKNLKQHIKVAHTDTKRFECDICNKKLSTKQKLTQHKNVQHSPVNTRETNTQFFEVTIKEEYTDDVDEELPFMVDED